MFTNVRKALLDYPKDCGLNIQGHPRGVMRQIKINEDSAALRKAFHKLTQGWEDTKLLQERRMKNIGEGSHLGETAARELATLGELGARLHAGELLATEEFDINNHHRQVLAGGVV
jgi:hypothetical protein